MGFAIALVAQDQPVVGIEIGQSLRHRFDRIVQRLLGEPQLLFCQLVARDVGMGTDHAHDAALGVADVDGAAEDVDGVALLVAEALHRLEFRNQPGIVGADHLQRGDPVLFEDQAGPHVQAALQLAVAVAELLLPGGREPDPAVLQIPVPDAVTRRLDGKVEKLAVRP